MGATKATASSKTKTKGAKGGGSVAVGAKSKTRDPVCSQAMSKWKSSPGGSMPPDVAKILGMCRAKASAMKKGQMYRQAGQEAKAQVHEHRAMTGRAIASERSALAREKIGQRKAKFKEKVRATADAFRASKGTREQRIEKIRKRANVIGKHQVEQAEARHFLGKRHGYDTSKHMKIAQERVHSLRKRVMPLVNKNIDKSKITTTSLKAKFEAKDKAKTQADIKAKAGRFRAKKGTREERIQKIRNRANVIGKGVIKRAEETHFHEMKFGRDPSAKTGKALERVHALRSRVMPLLGKKVVSKYMSSSKFKTYTVKNNQAQTSPKNAFTPKMSAAAHMASLHGGSTRSYSSSAGPSYSARAHQYRSDQSRRAKRSVVEHMASLDKERTIGRGDPIKRAPVKYSTHVKNTLAIRVRAMTRKLFGRTRGRKR